jgi:hypothetical protein
MNGCAKRTIPYDQSVLTKWCERSNIWKNRYPAITYHQRIWIPQAVSWLHHHFFNIICWKCFSTFGCFTHTDFIHWSFWHWWKEWGLSHNQHWTSLRALWSADFNGNAFVFGSYFVFSENFTDGFWDPNALISLQWSKVVVLAHQFCEYWT